MFAEIASISEQRMSTQWNLIHSDIRVIYDNTGEKAQTGETYLKFEILDNETDRKSIGITNRLYREFGFLNINVFVEKGTGTRYARGLADDVATIFRDVYVSGIWYRSPFIKRIGESNQGEFFQYNVSVPFQADFYI